MEHQQRGECVCGGYINETVSGLLSSSPPCTLIFRIFSSSSSGCCVTLQ